MVLRALIGLTFILSSGAARVFDGTNGAAKKIGRFVWYYGYCDIESGERSERRYGWVPALAVKKKGAAS